MADNNQQNTDRLDSLIKALQNKEEDEWIRAMAAQLLGEMGAEAEEAIPALINTFKDDSESRWLRETTLKALVEIGSAAVPHLLPLLQDSEDNQQISEYAIATLIYIGSEVVQDLIDTLQHEKARYNTAYVLSKINPLPQEAVKALMDVNKDENNKLEERWMAAVALENTGLDMQAFFTDNNLISPKNVTCPEGMDFDVYTRRCEGKKYEYHSFDDLIGGGKKGWEGIRSKPNETQKNKQKKQRRVRKKRRS